MHAPFHVLDCSTPNEAGSLWQRWRHGIRRLRQRNDWTRFVGANWADHIMNLDVTDRFHAKQGRSTGRLVLKTEGERLGVYLKRHYHLPWWRGLAAWLWPAGSWSPAFQELLHLERARAMGLPVPRVVAAAEYIGPCWRLRSMLAVEELTDMLPINEAIPLAMAERDPLHFARWKAAVARETARLARFLHARRWFHKDFYLCHFYLHRDDFGARWNGGPLVGRIHLIDLHRLARHPWTWPIWQIKDLGQLLYSSEIPGLTDRDRLRFWRHYLGAARRSWSADWLRRLVAFKWRRYRRHNLRRPPVPPRTLDIETAPSLSRGSS